MIAVCTVGARTSVSICYQTRSQLTTIIAQLLNKYSDIDLIYTAQDFNQIKYKQIENDYKIRFKGNLTFRKTKTAISEIPISKQDSIEGVALKALSYFLSDLNKIEPFHYLSLLSADLYLCKCLS